MTFLLGFVAGFLANQVFAMFTRALPQEWVRYKIRIGTPELERRKFYWFVPVTISTPPWFRRMLMPVLTEYLTVEVKLDDKDWIGTKWDVGDAPVYMLRTDGVMTVPAIIFMCHNTNLYLGGEGFENEDKVTQMENISIRVVRSMDKSIVRMTSIPVSLSNGNPVFAGQ